MTAPTLPEQKRLAIAALMELKIHSCPACTYTTKSKARLADHISTAHALIDEPRQDRVLADQHRS